MSKGWEEEFSLLWGEAPEGSLKHKKGQDILRFITELLKEERVKTIREVKDKFTEKPGEAGWIGYLLSHLQEKQK